MIAIIYASLGMATEINNYNEFPSGIEPGDDLTNIVHDLQNHRYDIDGGQQHDQIVYYIFDTFNVHSHESVFFHDNGNTHTYALVTGDIYSYINGTINSSARNFILANPNGIFFGKNNFFNLAGNFYCTTASAIKFEDNSIMPLDGSMRMMSCTKPKSFIFSSASRNINGQSAPNVNEGTKVTINAPSTIFQDDDTIFVVKVKKNEEYPIPETIAQKVKKVSEKDFSYFEANKSIEIDLDLWKNLSCEKKTNERRHNHLELGTQRGFLFIAKKLAFSAMFSNIADHLGYDLIDETNTRNYLEQGQNHYKKGSFLKAIHLFNDVLKKFDSKSTEYYYIHLLLLDAYQHLGETYKLETCLSRILKKFEFNYFKDNTIHALYLCKLAELYCKNKELEKARDLISHINNIAASIDDLSVWAYIENTIGNVYAASENYLAAKSAYNDALEYCHLASGHSLLIIQSLQPIIQLNRLKTMVRENKQQIVLQEYTAAAKSVYRDNTKGFLKIINLLSLASLKYDPENSILNAIKLSKQLELNETIVSYARGYYGHYALKQKKFSKAVEETRKAIVALEEYNRPGLSYQWYLQSGRAYKGLKKTLEAMRHYNQAIMHLKNLRQNMSFMNAEDGYHKMVKPVFKEMFELIISKAIIDSDMIDLAIQAMDNLKSTEIEKYFFDDCMTFEKVHNQLSINTFPPKTLLLYPVALKDKLILMIITSNHREVLTVPVKYRQLKKTIRSYVQQVQNPYESMDAIKQKSARIYEWLIRPIEEAMRHHMADIEAFIIAPDDLLRVLPFDTLYDGNRFLIEKYPTGLIFALSLTNMAHFNDSFSKALMAGLSEEARPRLPFVKKEIEKMKVFMPNSDILLDKKFTSDTLGQCLKKQNYRYLVFATHSRFKSDSNKSKIEMYNTSLSISEFQILLNNIDPLYGVDMISLNACETACGDSNAFLGMAGVALNSGARSVTASLWAIEDQAGYLIINSFYDGVINGKLTKARAMQKAKMNLIKSQAHKHPAYWGTTVLIGNWN